MEVVWSNDQISMLIKLFRRHSTLWDASNKNYKDKLKKNDAWDDIASEMNMSQKEVRTKIHILRSQFSRERKKINTTKRTRSGAGDVNISKWQWYEPLQFLLRGVTTSGKSNTMGLEGNPSAQSNTQLSIPPVPSTSQLPPPSSPLPPPPLPSPLPPSPSPTNNSKNRKCDENLIDAYEIMKSAKKKIEESKDEFEIYGQYVASELRNVKNERAFLQAKYDINNILLQARMGNFNSNNFGGYRTSSSTSTYVDTSTQTTDPSL